MNKIISSLVSGDIPQLYQMEQGDIAVNNADAIMWILQDQNGVKSVVQISGVNSFNGRVGSITLNSTDVINALTYTPANINSPAFTGVPTAATADPGTDTTQLATTAFVQTAIQDIVLPSAAQRLDKLLDVKVTEGAGIDGMFLQYSNQAGFWQATQLAPVALTNEYSSLTGTPDLSNVALTGSYDDLSNTPSPYVLPIASASTLGGIIVGGTLTISENGTLNAPYPTTLEQLTDVSVQEITAENDTVLQYQNSTGKWTNVALNSIAYTGAYSDLSGIPEYVASFNNRSGSVTFEASDITGVGGALLASPVFTGIPQAPTADPGNSTTQIATTAFVASALAAYTPADGYTTLQSMTDVSITEGSSINDYALTYSSAESKWVATPLASVAFSGNYNQLSNIPAAYNLPIATTTTLGGIIAGAGVTISASGVLSISGTGGSSTLQGLSDVSITESSSINNDALVYNSSSSKWVAQALATVAFSGNYSDLNGAPTTSVTSFNTRTNAITLEASDITGAGGALLASPVFTGIPQAPTADPGNSTTQIATTAFVESALSDYTPNLSGYAPIASPTFTGIPQAPTAAAGTVDTQLATTAFVADSFAPLSSPALTGTPTAPTATAGTNTTQIATTAFVEAAVTNATPNLSGYAPIASPAFTGNPTAPTPTQFSDGSSIATAAFVQTALGNFQTGKSISSTTTLNTSEFGTVFSLNGTTAYSVTLPAISSVQMEGSAYWFYCTNSAGVEIEASGTDPMITGPGTTTAGGYITMYGGDTAAFAVIANAWQLVDGTIAQNDSYSMSKYALIASPALTGTPTAPTATAGTSSTQIATTAFVAAAVTSASNLSGYAPLASPAFTGTPTAPTPTQFNSSTDIATTAFVQQAIGNFSYVTIIQSSETLAETAYGQAIQLDATSAITVTLPGASTEPGGAIWFYAQGSAVHTIETPSGAWFYAPQAGLTGTSNTTVTVQPGQTLYLVNRGSNEWDIMGGTWLTSNAPVISPSLTGTPTAPTATSGTSTTQIATTAFVANAVSANMTGYAPLASPALTGTPTAPTATSGTNTTQLATTAFVAASKYYDVSGGAVGTISASQLMVQFISGRTVTFPAGLTGSVGYASTTPTSSATFTITANGSSVGTMVIAAGSNSATFTASSSFSLSPGQILTVTAPATADATMATVSFTLLGLAS
jgi:hypothetical protein